MSPESSKYDASQIVVLTGLEAIRKRPGMYIGSTDERGWRNVVFEVVDRSVELVAAGYASRIEVTLLADGGVRVVDDAQGIAFEDGDDAGGLGLGRLLTQLWTGRRGPQDRAVAHSVGLVVANVLSSRLVAEVRNEDVREVREYYCGVPLTSATAPVDTALPAGSGTTITFWPDPDIFKIADPSFETIAERLRELTFLNRGLEISVADERSAERRSLRFYAPGGLRDMVASLDEQVAAFLHPEVIGLERADARMAGTMEVAFRWRASGAKQIQSFANSASTPYAGTHVVGFHDGLKIALNAYARDERLLTADDPDLGAGRIGRGLTAVVSVKLESPRFEGCTRGTLGNGEVRDCVRDAVAEHLEKWLVQHPREAAAILDHILRKAPRDDLGPAA